MNTGKLVNSMIPLISAAVMLLPVMSQAKKPVSLSAEECAYIAEQAEYYSKPIQGEFRDNTYGHYQINLKVYCGVKLPSKFALMRIHSKQYNPSSTTIYSNQPTIREAENADNEHDNNNDRIKADSEQPDADNREAQRDNREIKQKTRATAPAMDADKKSSWEDKPEKSVDKQAASDLQV